MTNARARVGGAARDGGVDLGSVAPEAAVQFLLDADVLTRAGGRAADRMIFAATLADAESWPGLLRVAEAQSIPSDARKNAVFWLAQAAGDRATEGLTSIVGDDSDEIEVRKQAVFALSQMRTDATVDALIDIARTNREPELRKSAIFWLGQSGSPRAITFFEEVLRG
jgi:HEAT repeat protein